jgi:hypothetical protein
MLLSLLGVQGWWVNSGPDWLSHRSIPNQNAIRFWKLKVPPVPSWVGRVGGSLGTTPR